MLSHFRLPLKTFFLVYLGCFHDLEVHPHLKDFIQHPDAEILCIQIESFLLLNGIEDAYFENVAPIPTRQ